MAHRNIGRYSNHPPAILSHAVHFRLSLANAVDFNTILIHVLSYSPYASAFSGEGLVIGIVLGVLAYRFFVKRNAEKAEA